MPVNIRKNYKLRNRTNYFNPDTSRVINTFGSPLSYQSRRIKIEGYETRLYWQFRYCEEHSGSTYFYTLTYNDANLPHYMDEPCFDYEHLRDLLTGGFRKQLLRKYGQTFKYFIGAELGDGKGSRGMHNNPHYHCMFFLESANNPRYPFKEITPEDFRTLVKKYWQGFDEDEDAKNGVFHDYTTDCKYGIAREGDNCGKVTDFRACMYCAKYVCKDAHLVRREKHIKHELSWKYEPEVRHSVETKERFYYEVLCPLWNVPTKPHLDEVHRDWLWTPYEVYKIAAPKNFSSWQRNIGIPDVPILIVVNDIIAEQNLHPLYSRFVHQLVNEKVDEKITEYRNRYCNKCRISHGVGDYALEFISDKMRPVIEVPCKKGFKSRPISMYYFRKLYTELRHDEKGQPIRVLNKLGIDYRVSKLPEQIKKRSDEIIGYVNMLDSKLYTDMINSNINTDVNESYTYERFMNDLINNNEKIYDDYAKFKLIYEDRFFKVIDDGLDCHFPELSPIDDFRRFLVPAMDKVGYSPNRGFLFMEAPDEGYLPYWQHPYFLQNCRVFAVFDLLTDYLFCHGDEYNQQQAEEVAKVKRFHTEEKVKDFYKKFNVF